MSEFEVHVIDELNGRKIIFYDETFEELSDGLKNMLIQQAIRLQDRIIGDIFFRQKKDASAVYLDEKLTKFKSNYYY